MHIVAFGVLVNVPWKETFSNQNKKVYAKRFESIDLPSSGSKRRPTTRESRKKNSTIFLYLKSFFQWCYYEHSEIFNYTFFTYSRILKINILGYSLLGY